MPLSLRDAIGLSSARRSMNDSNLAQALDECNREPIHIPGAIQPHGILLTVDPARGEVVQAAGPVAAWFGQEPEVIGRDLADLLGTELAERSLSAGRDDGREPVFLGSFRPEGAPGRLDLFAHQSTGFLVLELEVAQPQDTSAPHLLGTIRAISSALEAAPDIPALCHAAAGQLRRLTGFDRVMIYRFVEHGAGCVIAEAKLESMPPLLNHHYPASDIPQQARALYARNLIRVIPDVHYTPAPLMPVKLPSGADLDLGDTVLRSVSPVHIQYLKNMQVAASMSVSILVHGELWGLVACHHTSPKPVPFTLREACKHLGQVLSQQIGAREAAQVDRERSRLASERDAVVRAINRSTSVADGLQSSLPSLIRAAMADGVVLLLGGECASAGHVPERRHIEELRRWLLEQGRADLFSTASLQDEYPPAAAFASAGSGLLSVVLSRREAALVLWFRAETIETVNWAGNPHQPFAADSPLGTLNPRRSFELWRETVRGQSRPWTPTQLESARRLRDDVRDLQQREQLRLINEQLRRTLAENEDLLAQKDLLIREVDHRVQNSIQLVQSMLSLQSREAKDAAVKEQFEEATRRLMAVSIVHRLLWRSEELGNIEFGHYLRELTDGLIENWGTAWRHHIHVDADSVIVRSNAAVLLALVVIELMTNVVKYAYAGDVGPLEVSAKTVRNRISIRVADQGIGPVAPAEAAGFGSRLTRLLVQQLGGNVRIVNNKPGTAVVLTVPYR